jgi:hypothetical protein
MAALLTARAGKACTKYLSVTATTLQRKRCSESNDIANR